MKGEGSGGEGFVRVIEQGALLEMLKVDVYDSVLELLRLCIANKSVSAGLPISDIVRDFATNYNQRVELQRPAYARCVCVCM